MACRFAIVAADSFLIVFIVAIDLAVGANKSEAVKEEAVFVVPDAGDIFGVVAGAMRANLGEDENLDRRMLG